MSDFDGDDDGFFTSGDETPRQDRPLGLVVAAVARQIFAPDGTLVWDELAERERIYRATGRPAVIFVEDDTDRELERAARASGAAD